MDLDEVLRLFASLDRYEVQYAVFGAVAWVREVFGLGDGNP